MKGKILDFSAEQGGIILSQDGSRYLFAAEEWRGAALPQVGADVDFEVSDNKAVGVYLDVFSTNSTQLSVQTSNATSTDVAAVIDSVGKAVSKTANEATQAISAAIAIDHKNEKDFTLWDYAVRVVTKNYANFEGRARRKEYWGFILFYVLIYNGLQITAFILSALSDATAILALIIYAISWIATLAVLVPSIAVAVRRLHDTGRSGWFYLIVLIPLVNLWLLWIFCQDSVEDNQYGPNPKSLV